MRTWFQPVREAAPRANVDAATGDFAFEWPHLGLSLRGARRAFVPGRHLAFRLRREDPRGATVSDVAVDLLPVRDGTELRLRHDAVPTTDRADVANAWDWCLGRLIAGCPEALDAYYARLHGRPGFLSPFGGLWPDRADHEELLRDKRTHGRLGDADEALFRHWIRKGYVVLPQAVPGEWIDAMLAEVARDWTHGNPAVTVELCEGDGGLRAMHPTLRDRRTKVLEYHAVSNVARNVQFAPAIRRFLEQLFERPPMAFQSLLFRYGTEQAMHQDTAYVVLRSPMEFVGCWVALEDVQPGSGELQYFEGSHHIPEYVWMGRGRSRPPGFADDREFLAWVSEQSARAGCPVVRFLPKKGDALVWHADLVHGGSPRVRRELTRLSLVTHFCPVDVEPEGLAEGRHTRPVEHAPGAWYCHPIYGTNA